MAEVQHDMRAIAMEAQAHINRHEIECGKRWAESRRAFDDLAAQVERMNGILRAAQIFVLKGSFWLIGILSAGLVATIWYIITHH